MPSTFRPHATQSLANSASVAAAPVVPYLMLLDVVISLQSKQAPDACTRGAVYNALSRSDADIIVTPRYEAESFNFLCIPFTNLCVWNESTAWVTGYEGKYTNFREIDPEIIYQNQLNRYGKQNTAVSDSSSSASFVSSLMSYLPF